MNEGFCVQFLRLCYKNLRSYKFLLRVQNKLRILMFYVNIINLINIIIYFI